MLKRFWLAGLAAFLPTTLVADDAMQDLQREVRSILSDNCFQCHGPDEESRAAGLRLDDGEVLESMIDPDAVDDSELIFRITSDDVDLRMPPPDSGKRLLPEQIETIRQWIRGGAGFAEHWAFQKPVRPTVPATDFDAWVQNPIDAFVARRLQSEGLRPSPSADPRTLARRLSLDITGLPPSPRQVDRFAEQWENAGERDSVYQAYVQRLLDSPHYGERWGRVWLDAARYADSDGYEKDKPREAWFYRDWVIDSLNADRPYDDFVIRQIAGDLLPNATQDDHVATGFLRNSMVNEEGGADPEQFRMEAMYDRMDAIGKSILGLTIQCAQCHTHKYDPIGHEDYYGLFAFINNTHDAIIPVYTEAEAEQRNRVIARVEDLEQAIKQELPDWQQRMNQWEKSLAAEAQNRWVTPELTFLDSTIGGQKYLPQSDGSYLAQGYAPTNFKPKMTGRYDGKQISALRLEMLPHPNLPRGGPGRSIDGTWALSEIEVEIALSDKPDEFQQVKLSTARADLSPEASNLKERYDNKKDSKRLIGPVDFAIDGDEKTAWTNEVGYPRANRSQTAWFTLDQPVKIPGGQHAIVNVYLAQRHGGWNSDDNQTFNLGRHRLSFTADGLPNHDPLPLSVRQVLKVPPTERTEQARAILFSYWRTTLPELEPWNQQIEDAWRLHPHGTTQLTLQERDQRRVTSLLERGDFLSPVHEVEAHVPDFLHAMKPSTEPDRLRFARWLVDRDSPTTARSIVNRIWQAYFGIGLIETSEDLGSQSTPPSHQDLLDWLAVELMENDWSLKHLHRTIVSSATYRQSSNVSDELYQKDPYNRLLARGARFRVTAETVRDIALTASGLLSPTIGGPSVNPPAPDFLFQPPVSYGPKVWDEEQDADRYRRAIYTFRFRSVPYPMLEAFDAVPGNVSCVRRDRSNTPLQALTLLNEPLFVECAVALAGKTLSDAGSNDRQRIRYAMRRCVQRDPRPEEYAILQDYLNQQRRRIQSGELSSGDITAPAQHIAGIRANRNELATWTLLARVLLNLDETITRE